MVRYHTGNLDTDLILIVFKIILVTQSIKKLPVIAKRPNALLCPNGEAGAVLVEVDKVGLHVPSHQRHASHTS